jgi:cytochrome c-type biogenesis protein CcmE
MSYFCLILSLKTRNGGICYNFEYSNIMKKVHLILLIGVALAVGMLISTYSDSSTYANFAKAKSEGEMIHVIGKLDKGKEMFYNPHLDANHFSFYAKDQNGMECKVVFDGTKPQDFERSEQIVLTGKMESNVFHAEKILMKCPSKYTNDKLEITEAKSVRPI